MSRALYAASLMQQGEPITRHNHIHQMASEVVLAPVKEGRFLHPGQISRIPPLTEGDNFQQEVIIYKHETWFLSS